MPFNTSGPVLYYNKKAFSAAGLDPEKPPTNLAELRAAAEKLKANGVPAPMGLKTDPIFLEQWTAMGNRLFANNGNGRKARATKAVFDSRDRAPGLQLDVGHGEGRPRRDQLRHRHGSLRQPARHPQRLPRHDHRQQRRARAPSPRSWPPATTRTSSWGRAHAGPGCRQDPGRRVRAGWRAVHGEQVRAGEAGGRVGVPEVPRRAREHDHLGDRHGLPPDPRDVGRQHRDAGLLGAEPGLQGRLRPVAERSRHDRHRRDR